MFNSIIENTKRVDPIVHAITNYVTVNDCANVILSAGGSPIMADDIKEVSDIINISSSLVINVGTVNERTIISMIDAGKAANRLGKPVILDPVGAGASRWRDNCVKRLLDEVNFSIIRGNISEIKAISLGNGGTKGVDASKEDIERSSDLMSTIQYSKELSEKTKAVIAISGSMDIVSNSEKTYIIRNGHSMMTKITGAGCMLASIMGTYCGANYNKILESAVTATTTMGISGEHAYKRMVKANGGYSSFRMYLIDYICKVNEEILKGDANIEIM